LPLPPNFDPIDATVAEVMSYRRESRWEVHRKIRERVYESYLDGRIRKIIFASVKRNRERQIAASQSPTKKRKPGRPRKTPSSIKPDLPPRGSFDLRPLAASPPEAAAAPPTPLPIPTQPKTDFDAAAARSAELDDCDPSNSRTPRRR
jgi:hypothetical protein